MRRPGAQVMVAPPLIRRFHISREEKGGNYLNYYLLN